MKPKEILVVDDDEQIQYLLTELLRHYGYHVVCRSDVKSALEDVEKSRPDLVLLDLNLPDGNGLDLLRDVRNRFGRTVPVVVLSGMRQEEAVVEGLELGADDYVTKPFSPSELLARVSRCIRG